MRGGEKNIPDQVLQEDVKKKKPFIDLAEFGIEKGKDIRLEQVFEIFEKRPDLVDGMRRNFYWEIDHSVMFDFDQQHSMYPMDKQYYGWTMSEDRKWGVRRFEEGVRRPAP